MNLNTIPIFIQVVKNEGFSKAAIQLGLTKSKVSKSITQLENELGITLLHRTTRKISLTEAGERYYQQVTMGLHYIEDAEQSVMELQKTPQGRLRIAAPMSFGRLHIAPLIPQFLKRHPDITIDLVLSDANYDLIEQNLDVAIRAGNLSDSTVVARRLCPINSVVCASKKYLNQFGYPETPADLVNHNCLLYTFSKPVDEWTFKRGKKEQVVQVSGNFQVNNSEALRESLLGGVGIGRLPTFVAGSDIDKNKLIQVLSAYPMKQTALYAIFPERKYLPLKVRVFVDFVVEFLGGDEPYWDNFIN